jgi:hypothetical protein
MVSKRLKSIQNGKDGASFVYPDGRESSWELHEQMVAGVDDSALREESAKVAIGLGMPVEMAYRAFGLPVPIENHGPMPISAPIGSIVWLIQVIQALPSAPPVPLGTPGYNQYSTQKAHWLGWLAPSAGTGSYPRSEAPNRNAKYVYNHIVEPKLLLWLIAASGIDAATVAAAQKAAASALKMPSQAAAIRRIVPWDLLCEQLVRK